MSTVAFGALSTRRELSDSGTSTSTQPPGVSSYVDVLAGLVPAEVLAINAIVVASTAAQTPAGQIQLTLTDTYRWTFWLLLAAAAALFVLGRQPAPTSAGARAQDRQAGRSVARWENWEWQDLIRIAIAPAAYACWTMLEPSGVWSAVSPGMSSGLRLLIPLVGAVVLAAVTKALASHADKKPSPAQSRAAAASRAATERHAAQLSAPDPVPGPGRPIVSASKPPASKPPASKPPASELPASKLPASEPAASELPVSELPVSEPAASEGPVSELPVSESAAFELPVSEPPVSDGMPEDEPIEPATPAGNTDNADTADSADTTDTTDTTDTRAVVTAPPWVY